MFLIKYYYISEQFSLNLVLLNIYDDNCIIWKSPRPIRRYYVYYFVCSTVTQKHQPSKKYAKKISHHCNRNTTVSQISLVHTSNTKLKKNKALNINPLSQNIIISWSCLIVNCPATFNPKRTQMQRSHQLHIGWSL